jgi:type III secretion protein J
MVSSSCSSNKASRTRLAGGIALALLLAACGGQEIHTGLTETEANEVIAALSTAGISATKAAGEKEQWSVSVDQGDFARSVEVLRANGLPRENFESLGSVFKKEGFTTSPLAEHARLIYGLSQELSRTISNIDGVVQARVHITMPEPDPLSRQAAPSSASVFVKYRPGFDLRNQTGAIKSLVTNGVEGLTYERVSVVMVPARPTPMPITGMWSSLGSILTGILAVILLAAVAIAGAVFVPGWVKRRRAAAGATTPSNSIIPKEPA